MASFAVRAFAVAVAVPKAFAVAVGYPALSPFEIRPFPCQKSSLRYELAALSTKPPCEVIRLSTSLRDHRVATDTPSVVEEVAMEAVNPLTGLPVGTISLQQVLAQPGVEFLKGMMEGRYPLPPMAGVIPIVPVKVEVGRVLFRALPEERFYNPIGSIYGGYASTLLDTAMGCAVHSTLKKGEGYTSLEIKVVFHKQITHRTGDVRIEGKVLARGARIAAADGRITDSNGELLASGTTTCLIFSASGA